MMQMLRRFARSRSGNFGMMFVMASFPLIGSVAMAIEYANISRTQVRLQASVDAAVLFAGRYHEVNEVEPSRDDVKRFVDANFEGAVEDVRIEIVDDEIAVTALARTDALFFGSLAPGVFVNQADATVPINRGTDLELVLVLDNTYSMSADNKMVDLKRIATDFVTKIEDEAGDNDVRVGLVPFTNHVNVGMANRNASWITVPDDEEYTENRCRWKRKFEYSNCRMQTRYNDGVPYRRKVCDRKEISRQWQCRDVTVRKRWRGCVGSRPSPHTLKDQRPDVPFEGLLNVWCGEPIKPLTGNFGQLRAAIGAMYPTQDTYMAPGVMWGLRLLTPEEPFTDARPASTDRRKVMVLMTDGDNQRSANLPWNPGNWGTDLAQADNWTKQACAEAKANGVTVFSIAFGKTVSAAGVDVMRECATDKNGFYQSRDAGALEDAFEDIGRRISALRLTS
ncbi:MULTISPECIES: pilus assembly protein [unclassified Roseitalea]|uniref:pilus assembly protein n=1 Tax=unclassified Roseitalea TaxID=2639107 RepID=UPI00273FA9C5|nr:MULTISPECIES: pilus assembly protein [unclassified Roseitalea]